MSYKEIQRRSFKEKMHQAWCSSLLSATGDCGQPKKEPQFPTSGSPQLGAGIWPNCCVRCKGIHGGVKSGGATGGEEARQGPHGRGWVDCGSATVGKLLSVKYVEPLDETSFPRPHPSSFTSFTLSFPRTFTSSFSFPTLALLLLSNGEADSSCNLICSSLLKLECLELAFSTFTFLVSSFTASFTSCSSSGRTRLTNLVEVHVEHHSTREVGGSSMIFNSSRRRMISSGLVDMALARPRTCST